MFRYSSHVRVSQPLSASFPSALCVLQCRSLPLVSAVEVEVDQAIASMGNRGDCTLLTCPVPDGFFSSPPSAAGSGFFLAAFSLLIPVHLFTGIRYRTPLYSSAIIAGLAFEVMGYIGRILLKSDVASTSYFALYLTGVNMGPTFLTAAIFLTLPRIVVLYGKGFTLISQPLYFAMFFLAFGAFALAFETAGAAFAATGGIPEEVSLQDSLQPSVAYCSRVPR